MAEWEEPRHSGRLVSPHYPTVSHSATHSPLFRPMAAPAGTRVGGFGAKSGFCGWDAVGRRPAQSAVSRADDAELGAILHADSPTCWVNGASSSGVPQPRGSLPVGGDMNRLSTPSPSIGDRLCRAVRRARAGWRTRRQRSARRTSSTARSGAATSRTARCAGKEAKRNGFGGGAIKESSLAAAELDATKIGKVNNAAIADGLTRHGGDLGPRRAGARARHHVRERRPATASIRRSSTPTCATAPTSPRSVTNRLPVRAQARSR